MSEDDENKFLTGLPIIHPQLPEPEPEEDS